MFADTRARLHVRSAGYHGWNLKIIKTDRDGLIPSVVSGKFDCCISTLGVTEDRLAVCRFL